MVTAPRELASRLNDIAQGLLGGDKRTLKEAAEHLTRNAMTDLKPGLLRAAEIAEEYRPGDPIARGIAYRIRQAASELPEPVEPPVNEPGALVAGLKSLSASFEIHAQNMRGDPECVYEDSALCKEAADRIEALEAENARLRKALKRIADLVDTDVGDPLDDAIEFARAALGSEKK